MLRVRQPVSKQMDVGNEKFYFSHKNKVYWDALIMLIIAKLYNKIVCESKCLRVIKFLDLRCTSIGHIQK